MQLGTEPAEKTAGFLLDFPVNESPVPRWLKLVMLPILASAAFCADYEVQRRFADHWYASNFDEASSNLLPLGQLLAPLLAACFVAYPLARLYGKDWKPACLGVIVIYAGWQGITHFDLDEALRSFVLLLQLFLFVFVLAGLAALARFVMHNSIVVVVPDTEAGNPGTLTLKLALLPVLAVAMFINREHWQEVLDFAQLSSTTLGKRSILISSAILGPATLALAFAFPIARIYGLHALAAGFLASLLMVWWNRWMLDKYSLPWVGVIFSVELASQVFFPALLAWWVARRFRGSRLAIRGDTASG